jgi:hypothetical protein
MNTNIPPDARKKIQAITANMGKRLIDAGFASRFEQGEIPGKGSLILTDNGLRFAADLQKIFGRIENPPSQLFGIEVTTMVLLILGSSPLSSN